eukprot:COSAG01_NODE_25986_length_726_cov_63.494418_1_plen_139_part_01
MAPFRNAQQYVLEAGGDLPLVITIPHGGTWEPGWLPNQNGITPIDTNTQPLGLAIATQIAALDPVGRAPFTVALGLHRKKVDVNRDKGHLCPNLTAQQAWEQYHEAVRLAVEQCCARFGGCHLVDLHGCSHYYKVAGRP